MWTEEARLTPPLNERWAFGGFTALDDQTTIIGSAQYAFVYTRIGKTWTYERALAADAPLKVGNPVALQGDFAAVLFHGYQDVSDTLDEVFIFDRTTNWSFQRVVVPTAGLGEAIALAEDSTGTTWLAVGTGQNVLVHRHDVASSTWVLDTTLSGGTLSAFGSSLAFWKDELLVGSPNENVAYVYHRAANTPGSMMSWVLEQKISAPIGDQNFGVSLTMRDDTAFIGGFGIGVFHYARDASATWVLLEEIVPPDTTNSSGFGTSMAMSASAAVFGAPTQRSATGAVYVYALAQSLGDACTSADSCASGFCVDGVCCDSACHSGSTVDCLSCAGEKPGTCSPQAAATICRAAIGACDVEERCNGATATCPLDAIRADGSDCSESGGTGQCVAGECAIATLPPPSKVALQPPTPLIVQGGGCAQSPGDSHSSSGAVAICALCIGSLLMRRRRRDRRLTNALPIAGIIFIAGACDTSSGTTTTHAPETIGSSAARLQTWAERQTLASSNPAETGFGISLSIAADTAIVGDDTDTSGSAHIFVRVGNTWTEQTPLTPSPPLVDSHFGEAVALDATARTAVVSAPVLDAGAGAVFVFERTDGNTWTQVAKLESPSPAPGAVFGFAVAIDSDQIVVGEPNRVFDVSNVNPVGAVYIFGRTNGVWAMSGELDGTLSTIGFGAALALQGSTLVVGAFPTQIINTQVPSSVHFFTAVGTSWNEDLELTSSVFPYVQFGTSVSIDNDRVAFGERSLSPPSPPGAVRVYVRDMTGAWIQEQRLVASNGTPNDAFGLSVRLHGSRLLVGAPAWSSIGTVYDFEHVGSLWSETKQFVSPNPTADGSFGQGMDGAEDMVLIGAFAENHSKGVVHAFFFGNLGTPCTSGDGCASGACVDGVCCDGRLRCWRARRLPCV